MKEGFSLITVISILLVKLQGHLRGKTNTTTTTTTLTGTEWFHSDSPINRDRFQTERKRNYDNQVSPKWFC